MGCCNCGDKAKRKLFTNTCLVCGQTMAATVSIPDLADVYKFRAECLADVGGFLNNLWPGCKMSWMQVEVDKKFPDCEVTVKITGTDLDELRIALSGVKDGHVMFETLNTLQDYNGQRWFVSTGYCEGN